MNETMRIGLQELENASQVFSTSVESLNTMSLQTLNNRDGSMSDSLVGCGYNLSRKGKSSLSARVFVLGVDGKPLTSVKPQRAKRLMKDKQAKPVWNKFSQFGIQMLVETRKEPPKPSKECEYCWWAKGVVGV